MPCPPYLILRGKAASCSVSQTQQPPEEVYMKTDRLLLAPDKVFERLQSFCIARRVEGSTVIFLQGEAPRGVLLLLRGDIALTPDATQPSLCRVAGAGSILGLPANLSSKRSEERRVGKESRSRW